MTDFIRRTRPNVLDIKPYIPGKPIEEVERELGISNVIKLASNENPLGPSPEALMALKQKSHQIHLYPDGYAFYLRGALSEKLGVQPANIIIGNGSDELLKLLAETFVQPGDQTIISTVTFSEYEFVTRVADGEPVLVEHQDFRFDLEAMAEAVTEKTKIIFICNPNNPTGTYVTTKEIATFLDRVPQDVIVVLDEAYYEYVVADDYPNSVDLLLQGRKNVIILRTFSKIYGLAGLRVGYGIGHEELIALINRTKEPFNVNLLAQEAARAALSDEEHLTLSKQNNEEGKQYLYEEFSRLGLKYLPTEANFIFLDTGRNSKELFQEMLKQGVIIRSGDIFGLNSFIRVTVGTKSQNERFIQVLEELLL